MKTIENQSKYYPLNLAGKLAIGVCIIICAFPLLYSLVGIAAVSSFAISSPKALTWLVILVFGLLGCLYFKKKASQSCSTSCATECNCKKGKI